MVIKMGKLAEAIAKEQPRLEQWFQQDDEHIDALGDLDDAIKAKAVELESLFNQVKHSQSCGL